MSTQAPINELGHYILMFQALEEAMSALIARIAAPDPEYIHALTAELEFGSKARAADVIFGRFAQVHGLCERSPHPGFHKLIARIQRFAERRNELVHSYYTTFTTPEGQIGIRRKPTRLKPSTGKRERPSEDLLRGSLQSEVFEMSGAVRSLNHYHKLVIRTINPDRL